MSRIGHPFNNPRAGEAGNDESADEGARNRSGKVNMVILTGICPWNAVKQNIMSSLNIERFFNLGERSCRQMEPYQANE